MSYSEIVIYWSLGHDPFPEIEYSDHIKIFSIFTRLRFTRKSIFDLAI